MTGRFAGFVIGGLAAGAMVAGPIAAANASDTTIKLDIVHAGPQLHRDGLRLAVAFKRYAQTHRAEPVVRAIRAQDTDYLRLRSRLERTAASTHDGLLGRRAIVAGVTLVIRSNRTIAAGLARHGNAGLTPSELSHARALSAHGTRDIRRGVTLLEHR